MAQIYTSKVYNVIYISGNTLDKRNTDFQEEEEPGRKETIFLSPLAITALSLYLVISLLASITQCVESACMHAACMESDRVFRLFLGVPKHQSLSISSISIRLGWSRVRDGQKGTAIAMKDVWDGDWLDPGHGDTDRRQVVTLVMD